MRKLDILVPQYEETDDILKGLLDSIEVQQNINLKEDVGVIICNDGTDVKLSDELFSRYSFPIEYFQEPHRGVSGTRNACLDHSKAEYVMFCDADDAFFNSCGMYIIFREMRIGFDTLVSAFIEESRIPEGLPEEQYKAIGVKAGEPNYVPHEMDSTFVHGKVHRRQFLIDNNIRWDEELLIHEDSFFNCLCQRLAPADRAKYSQSPFYLWRWRDESVCRHDPLYLNKTYVDMLKSNSALARQFIRRGRKADAEFYITSMIYDAYYSFNHDRWWSEEGKPYLDGTEKRFKEYWDEFKDYFFSVDDNVKKQIIMGIKNRFFQEGLFMEKITFDDWIKHIESI